MGGVPQFSGVFQKQTGILVIVVKRVYIGHGQDLLYVGVTVGGAAVSVEHRNINPAPGADLPGGRIICCLVFIFRVI